MVLVLLKDQAVKSTYAEVLQVVNADVVAEQVDQRILEHASVTVAVPAVSNRIASCPAKKP